MLKMREIMEITHGMQTIQLVETTGMTMREMICIAEKARMRVEAMA